jgi:hypothetical protein
MKHLSVSDKEKSAKKKGSIEIAQSSSGKNIDNKQNK